MCPETERRWGRVSESNEGSTSSPQEEFLVLKPLLPQSWVPTGFLVPSQSQLWVNVS